MVTATFLARARSGDNALIHQVMSRGQSVASPKTEGHSATETEVVLTDTTRMHLENRTLDARSRSRSHVLYGSFNRNIQEREIHTERCTRVLVRGQGAGGLHSAQGIPLGR